MPSLRKKLIAYAADAYGTAAEYPWESAPDYAVLRHGNGKWYGVIMDIHPSKLGLEGQEKIDILNVKCDPFLLNTFLSRVGYYRAYHMNKNNWISVTLDGRVDIDQVCFMLDMSYEIIDKKKK